MSLGPKTTPIRAGLRPVSRSHNLPAFCGERRHIAQRHEIELRTVVRLQSVQCAVGQGGWDFEIEARNPDIADPFRIVSDCSEG